MNRQKTLEKAVSFAEDAANQNCELVVLGGEACVGGYPYWLELTGGAIFNSNIQKEFFAEYSNQAVVIERGDLQILCDLAREKSIAIYIGIVEKPSDRGESLFAALVFINQNGEIKSVQRKLVPTYEERLVWANGDGNGLRVHNVGAFTVGGLNCWENWNPLARAALYGQGEDFHICVFPGGIHNTHDITRFIAKESRSFVASVSCVMTKRRFSRKHDSSRQNFRKRARHFINRRNMPRRTRRRMDDRTFHHRRKTRRRRNQSPKSPRRTPEFRRCRTLFASRCFALKSKS